jgi:hypothetical protein
MHARAHWKSVGYAKLYKSKKSLVVCICADLPSEEATFAVGNLERLNKILNNQNIATTVDLVTLKKSN